jgi:hypothetical protein
MPCPPNHYQHLDSHRQVACIPHTECDETTHLSGASPSEPGRCIQLGCADGTMADALRCGQCQAGFEMGRPPLNATCDDASLGGGCGLLSRCEGDCSANSDCADGLDCFQRDAFALVPGCEGGGDEHVDYCFDATAMDGTACPDKTYNSVPGGVCMPFPKCEEGKFRTGQTASDVGTCAKDGTCSEGYFLFGSGEFKPGDCEACAPNTFQDQAESTVKACMIQTICQPGEHLVDASVRSKGQCTACADGTFQPRNESRLTACTAHRSCPRYHTLHDESAVRDGRCIVDGCATPAEFYPRQPTTQTVQVAAAEDGLCMSAAAHALGATVVLAACDPANGLHNQWSWDATTKLLRNVADDFCADDKGGVTGVHMWVCTASNKNQHWEWDPTTKLLHSNKGRCLQAPAAADQDGSVLELAACDSSSSRQQWTMPSPALQRTSIRIADGEAQDLCIRGGGGGGEEANALLAACDSETPSSMQTLWTWDPKTKLLQNGESGACLEGGGGGGGGGGGDAPGDVRVRMSSCNAGDANQRWEWDPTTMLLHTDLHTDQNQSHCLAAPAVVEAGSVLELATCDPSSGGQQWRMPAFGGCAVCTAGRETSVELPIDGLVGWYRPGGFDAATQRWENEHPDLSPTARVGSAGVFGGARATVTTRAGSGAAAEISYVAGTTDTTATFAGALSTDVTVCSVTRYTGTTRGRILSTSSGNWLHGHWSGKAGVAYYEGWVTDKITPPPVAKVTDWIVMCGQNGGDKKVEVNGISVRRDVGVATGSVDADLTVNIGPHASQERSDFGLYEIMVWDRPLVAEEREAVTTMLLGRL